MMLISVKLIAWGALTGLSMGIVTQAQSKRTEPAGSDLQSHYAAAQRFQQKGNPEAAAREYRIFLSDAQGELAVGHTGVGDYSKAASLFDDALALQPNSPVLRLRYASTALKMGNFQRAESLARALLADGQGDSHKLADAHQILGQALLKQNKDKDAKAEMEEAVKLDPTFVNGYGLAVVCLDLDDQKCAEQIFGDIERSFGDTPALHMQIGLAYGNSDFVPQSIVEFRKVIAADPKYPTAHYCLAAALLESGDDQKNVPEAEAELKTELTISPNDFLTYAALGKLAVTYNKYAEAETYLKRATELNRTNPDAFLYLGQMYFNTNRSADAEPALRKAIELTKDPSRNRYQIQKAHFLLGRILMQEHHPDEAHAEMEIARTFADKGLSHDKNELAGLLNNSAATGTEGSTGPVETAAAVAPQSASPEDLSNLNAFEKELTPAIADSYNNLGVIAATGKSYTEATSYFQHAAQWSPNLDGLDLNWGRAAFMASQFSDATAPLSRYIKSHPEDAGVRGALALSQFMTQDYDGCVATFKPAEDKLASIPQMEYAFAEALVRTGEISSGKRRLESLESAHPEIPDVHRSLGEVYDAQADRIRATREFKTAILLNANDSEAHYDLGRVSIESGDVGSAIPELETATKLTPDNPLFHRELASAYGLVSRKDDETKELRIYESLKNPPATSASPASAERDAVR